MTWETWQLIGNIVVNVLTLGISLGFLRVAWQALDAWKDEMRARRRMQFWDDLNDALHEYIPKLQDSIITAEMIKSDIDHYAIHKSNPDDAHDYTWAERYLEEFGVDDHKKISKSLSSTLPAKDRLAAIVSKGKVFTIANYSSCVEACNILCKMSSSLDWFACMIDDPKFNLSTPESRKMFDRAIAAGSNDLLATMLIQKGVIEEFIRDQYAILFK